MTGTDDKQLILRMLKGLFDSRRIEMSADGLRAWLDALHGLSVEQIKSAIVRFNRESTEYPTPAALRAMATLSLTARASIAWSAVRRAIAAIGAYESVTFDDPMTNAAIRAMGGWVELCDTETDQMVWAEREFARHYEAICRSGLGDPSPLLGLTDSGNLGNGFADVAAPVEVSIGLPLHGVERRLRGPDRRQISVSSAGAELAERLTVADR